MRGAVQRSYPNWFLPSRLPDNTAVYSPFLFSARISQSYYRGLGNAGFSYVGNRKSGNPGDYCARTLFSDVPNSQALNAPLENSNSREPNANTSVGNSSIATPKASCARDIVQVPKGVGVGSTIYHRINLRTHS